MTREGEMFLFGSGYLRCDAEEWLSGWVCFIVLGQTAATNDTYISDTFNVLPARDLRRECVRPPHALMFYSTIDL